MSLKEITSPEEIRDTRSFSHLEWGAFLSVEDYTRREEVVLGHTPMCKNRLKSWGLYIEDGTRVAACETLERPALVQHKDGKLKATSTFSIGAVFTPKEHRGKGYASIMMRQMASGIPFKPTLSDAEIIKATGVSDVDQSLRVTPLWSDVGTFYEKFGWIGTTDLQYAIEVGEPATQNGVNGHSNGTNGHTNSVKFLSESDVYSLADVETASFISDFEKFPYKGNYKCGVVPDRTVYEWHFARAKFLAEFAKVPEPKIFGAQLGDSWMAWHHMYNARELVILRAKLAKAEDLVELVAAAKKHLVNEGFSNQINKIIIWEQEREWDHIANGVPLEAITQAIEKCGGKQEHRGSSIPCVMFVEDQLQKEPMEFVDHGKLTWC
ncbi:Lysine acetyltransferase [Yarrowia sp. C11]|nr:Lysine acetyltransferase [Yarrowia sp. E02]KAG5372081.1 Lysine acetyltransferase [Yarrowia sp. C11]